MIIEMILIGSNCSNTRLLGPWEALIDLISKLKRKILQLQNLGEKGGRKRKKGGDEGA